MNKQLSRMLLGLAFGFTLVQAAPATVTRGQLSVTYHDPADQRLLGTVFQEWNSAAIRVQELGLVLPTMKLEASVNAAHFAQLTGQPAQIAALTRGHTVFTQRLGALAGRGILKSTLRHEAFHAAQPVKLPRWLAEGLARIFSGESAADPRGATGLESLSEAQLDERLRGWQALGPAYVEASRRAAQRLSQLGWHEVLRTGQ